MKLYIRYIWNSDSIIPEILIFSTNETIKVSSMKWLIYDYCIDALIAFDDEIIDYE
jgi:hypothetical protein